VSSSGLLTICFANLYPQELSDEASGKAAEVVGKFAECFYRAGCSRRWLALPRSLGGACGAL
jgi:hypothetical protein